MSSYNTRNIATRTLNIFFPPDLPPSNMLHATTGHVLIDNEKMSKSLGNFVMLHEAVAGSRDVTVAGKSVHIGWTADSTRFALADAGDSLEDANFECGTADLAILRLTNEKEFFETTVVGIGGDAFRDGDLTFNDRAFLAKINRCAVLCDESYEKMRFRDALKYGFFELQTARDAYREAQKILATPMHAEVLQRFVHVQVKVLAPICPHMCEHVWRNVLGNKTSIFKSDWPETFPLDHGLLRASEYLEDTSRNVRLMILKKKSKKSKGGKKNTPGNASAAASDGAAAAVATGNSAKLVLYVNKNYPAWRVKVLGWILDIYNSDAPEHDSAVGELPKDLMKRLGAFIAASEDLKSMKKQVMQAASYAVAQSKELGVQAFETKTPFDELDLLETNSSLLCGSIGVAEVRVVDVTDGAPEGCNKTVATNALPGKPSFEL